MRFALYGLIVLLVGGCQETESSSVPIPVIVTGDTLPKVLWTGSETAETFFRILSIGPVKDTYQIENRIIIHQAEYDTSEAFVFYHVNELLRDRLYNCSKKRPWKNDSIRIVVDTSQIMHCEFFILWYDTIPRRTTSTRAFPVYLTNNSSDTISIRETLGLELRADVNRNKWSYIFQQRNTVCPPDGPWYNWAPGETILTGLPITEGRYRRQARVHYSDSLFSDVFYINTDAQ